MSWLSFDLPNNIYSPTSQSSPYTHPHMNIKEADNAVLYKSCFIGL
jgi:hypothetical protein